jgi:hypothetical protein
MKKPYEILLIECKQPYPVDCAKRTPAIYLRRRGMETQEGIKYYACGYAVNGDQHCQFNSLFDPRRERK